MKSLALLNRVCHLKKSSLNLVICILLDNDINILTNVCIEKLWFV